MSFVIILLPSVPQQIGYADSRDFVTVAERHQRYCEIAGGLGHDIRFGYLSETLEQYEHPKFEHTVQGFPVSLKLPYIQIILLSSPPHPAKFLRPSIRHRFTLIA
jgi:hypothetical protein